MDTCSCQKKKPRDNEFVNNIDSRLNRIVGQINGINKMVKDNRYCKDVLIQIAAVESALKEVGYMVLKDHLLTCVSDDIRNDDYSSLLDSLEIAKKLN